MYNRTKYFTPRCLLKCMSLGGIIVLLFSSIILYRYSEGPANGIILDKSYWRLMEQRDSPVRTENFPKKALIILAYWRGGSTFIGKIVDRHPDVFYFFEPLFGQMKFPLHDNMTLHYIDGTEKTYRPRHRSWIDRITLENIIACRLEKISMEILTERLIRLGKLSEPYITCLGNDSSAQTVVSCFSYLNAACKMSNFIAMKVLRIGMNSVIEMLERNEHLKVIHLVRDPRGVLMSRWRTENDQQYAGTEHVAELCSEMAKNHFHAEMYSYKHPGRIKLVRYEDLARYPISVSQDIYNFIGLDFKDQIRDYVREITSYGLTGQPDPPKCYLCVVKRNSTKVAFKWRKYIPSEKAREVDAYCKNVYSLFGYRQLNETELKRAAFPAVRDPF